MRPKQPETLGDGPGTFSDSGRRMRLGRSYTVSHYSRHGAIRTLNRRDLPVPRGLRSLNHHSESFCATQRKNAVRARVDAENVRLLASAGFERRQAPGLHRGAHCLTGRNPPDLRSMRGISHPWRRRIMSSESNKWECGIGQFEALIRVYCTEPRCKKHLKLAARSSECYQFGVDQQDFARTTSVNLRRVSKNLYRGRRRKHLDTYKLRYGEECRIR